MEEMKDESVKNWEQFKHDVEDVFEDIENKLEKGGLNNVRH